jgi:hypothetical protein
MVTKKAKTMRRAVLIGLGGLTLSFSQAQVPNSVLDESPISGDLNQATKIVLPDSPNLGTNSQSLNFSPTINPGNTSLTAPVTAPPGGSTAASGTTPGGSAEQIAADKARNIEFDPANETLLNSKSGAIWNVRDNSVIESRYDRYLNQDAHAQAKQQEYLSKLTEILQLLVPKNPYATRTTFGPTREDYAKAYKLLRSLSSEYAEYDNGVAATLANQIDALNTALTDRQRLYAEVADLEKEIKRLTWNMDVTTKRRIDSMSERRGADATQENSARAAYAMQKGAHYARDIAKLQALQVGKTAQAEAKMLLAKTEFQTLLMQHFVARRFQQVLIGGAFYRTGFQDGEMAISADTKLTQMLTEKLGVPVTVTTLEAATVEAIEEVRRGLNAVGNMLSAKRTTGAEKRLMETLVVGENLPEMLSFPVEQRNAILVFRQIRREATKAIEVKDFTRAEEKNDDLVKLASDYDPAPIKAAIAAAKSQSNLHLAQARNAATSGDKATMEAEVKLAAQLWPQNPSLESGAAALLDQFDQQGKALKELDALLGRSDLRGIEQKREIFTAAVANDPGRQKKLRSVMDQIVEIERALERAREYGEQGSPAQAWQIVEPVSRRHPSDQKLIRAVTDYSMRAADFVKKVNAAREAESQGSAAKALAQYLAAYQLNPASDEIRQKIISLAESQLATVKQP